MEIWIPITIAAAFLQNLRSALQKYLKGQLSTGGSTYCRFFYAAPCACLYLVGLLMLFGFELPEPNNRFIAFGIGGGIAQIVATFLLVHLFSYRNFAVGNAYSKTETVQTAIFGVVILGDTITAGVGVAIFVALGGVMALSLGKGQVTVRSLLTGWTERPALIGIFSGTMFGVSAVMYRAASLSLGGEGFLVQSAFTLATVTLLQAILMGLYLRIKEPGELTRVVRAWRVAVLVGVTGMLGSAGWFAAMTIQNAAHVRALGQIELVFTFIASTVFFKEKSNLTEVLGIVLIVGGILILLLQ
ncbi:MAG: EamA family transporter [Pseudomonadota bacterium]